MSDHRERASGRLQANTKGIVLDHNVRVAHPAGLDLDEHLVLARKLQRGFLDAEAGPEAREGGLLEGLGERHGVLLFELVLKGVVSLVQRDQA